MPKTCFILCQDSNLHATNWKSIAITSWPPELVINNVSFLFYLISCEPFRMIIDGRSNCGKTKLLIELMKEFQQNGTFDQIIIICPTFPRNQSCQNEDFIFQDKNILICDCDFDDVEQYIKISRC